MSFICCVLVLSIDYSDSLSIEKHNDHSRLLFSSCDNYDMGERSVNRVCVCERERGNVCVRKSERERVCVIVCV